MSDLPQGIKDLMEDKELIADLRNRIKHHPPKHDGIIAKHADFREAVFIMGRVIGTLVPKGREQAVALTKLEELMFWGNAGIARNQTHQFKSEPPGGDNCYCGEAWNVPVHK